MKVRFSRRARQDLLDVWSYVASENPEAADRLLDRIEAACLRLNDNPNIGLARPKFGEGARMIVIDKWLALYRVSGRDIQIVRVIHGARDLGRLIPKPPAGP